MAEAVARRGGLKHMIEDNLESIDAREANSLKLFDDTSGRPVTVRVGRYGPYIERVIGEKGGEPEYQRANLPESATPDEITLEMAEKLFATPASGRELGVNPANGRMVVAKEGRFGPYVTELVRDDEHERASAKAEETVAAERAAEDVQRAEEGKRPKNWETKTAAAQRRRRGLRSSSMSNSSPQPHRCSVLWNRLP